jgi:hypothetical protein
MKRRGRRHLPKLRSSGYRRGGGVFRFPNTPWGPMNVNDGGRDEPLRPISPSGRLVIGAIVGAAIVLAVVIALLLG